MPSLALYRAAAILALVLCNGFFVAAEFAIVSLRHTRLQQMIAQRRPGARLAAALQADLDAFLPAVQLGVTLASLTLGWVGEPFVARLLMPAFTHLPHARLYAGVVSAVLAFGLITYLEVIFGELVPKSLALRQGEKVALAVAGPSLAFMRATRPAVRVMNASASRVLRLFRLSPAPDRPAHSPEELKMIATATRLMGLLPEMQEAILHRVLDLDTVTVREIMTPRQEIFSLPADLPLPEASARVTQVPRSRVPVYDPVQGPEQIVGVIYAKDLARWMHFHLLSQATPQSIRQGAVGLRVEREMRLRDIMHDVLVVPESQTAAELLLEFQKRRRHLAIVVDEFGSLAGLVTVEDVLEQIAGKMEDEFAAPATDVQRLASGSIVLPGNVSLLDLEAQLSLKLPRTGEVETLAGFLLQRLQRIPQTGDALVYGEHRFTVAAMQGHRIMSVRVERAAGSGAGAASTPRPQERSA
jgi:putative hemolysin